MKKVYENFEIEYTDSDLYYIDEFISYLLSREKLILDFFCIKKLDKKIHIKFFDDLNEYRSFRALELAKYNKKISSWEIACSINNPEKSCINIVSFKESLKCTNHENDKIQSFILIGAHEFVHTCHEQYKNYVETPTWFNEGLATYLSGQYENVRKSLILDCNLADLMEGKVSYQYYFLMVQYIINNYDKDFVMKLASNTELIKKYTPIIFEEAKEHIKQEKGLI